MRALEWLLLFSVATALVAGAAGEPSCAELRRQWRRQQQIRDPAKEIYGVLQRRLQSDQARRPREHRWVEGQPRNTVPDTEPPKSFFHVLKDKLYGSESRKEDSEVYGVVREDDSESGRRDRASALAEVRRLLQQQADSSHSLSAFDRVRQRLMAERKQNALRQQRRKRARRRRRRRRRRQCASSKWRKRRKKDCRHLEKE